MQCLEESLEIYGKLSSAKLNWEKTEALWFGSNSNHIFNLPKLPKNVKCNKTGFKYLGVFLGNDDFEKKNWEGLVDRVHAKLSKWKWLLPQLSYRGRVLIANNLIASTLWHKFMVLDPPMVLIREIQKMLVDFFWSGQHWLKPAMLYLPVHEGGQGLIDIKARLATFRLMAVQRLLYH